jgi:hypothetical protein
MPPVAGFLAAKQEKEREYFRIDDPSQLFHVNYGDAWRLPAALGHGATALVDYFELRGNGWGPGSNVSALLNLRYIPSRTPVSGMRKIFENGDAAVYFNPRAVPRVFVASRYRSFAAKEGMLGWIVSPLFSPRETVLLLESDLEKLSPAFRRSLNPEVEASWVVDINRGTAVEKAREKVTDPQTLRDMEVFQAPWGWTSGDEVTFVIRPDRPLERCYLIIKYYPTRPEVSRTAVRLAGPERETEIQVEIPGLKAEAAQRDLERRIAVNLGPLASEAHRISIERTDACSANIDSLRISATPPAPQADEGSAEIVSFEPNRITVSARTVRPSFLVLSEVFYPGWEAWVNGRQTPVLQGDYILRAVPLPEGRHTVELRFRPQDFRWGLTVSLLSLAAIAALLIVTRRSDKARRGPDIGV